MVGRYMMRRLALFFVFNTLAVLSLTAAELVEINSEALKRDIGARKVSFLARDLDSGATHILSGSDLETRHTPWSTFKIPNLIIALETRVAPTIDAERKWDPVRRPALAYWPKAWRQDQTLRTAFQRSAVWYFRDIAQDVGVDAYRSILKSWDYGNGLVPERSDNFWLNGTLKISVEEQVDFLERLLVGSLRVDEQSIDALRLASHVGQKQGVSLYGKTGSGPLVQGNQGRSFEGWYVGFIDRSNSKPVVFALYVEAESYRALRDFRKNFSVDLLEKAGLLPAAFLD